MFWAPGLSLAKDPEMPMRRLMIGSVQSYIDMNIILHIKDVCACFTKHGYNLQCCKEYKGSWQCWSADGEPSRTLSKLQRKLQCYVPVSIKTIIFDKIVKNTKNADNVDLQMVNLLQHCHKYKGNWNVTCLVH